MSDVGKTKYLTLQVNITPTSSTTLPITIEHENEGHNETHSDSGHLHSLRNKSSLRDFLTVLALSCHAIFEGLAIGLEDNPDVVWTLFAGMFDKKRAHAVWCLSSKNRLECFVIVIKSSQDFNTSAFPFLADTKLNLQACIDVTFRQLF